MPTAEDDAYDRGHVAGAIAARLAGHDQQFAAINGSLERVVNEMHALTIAVQRLGDQAAALNDAAAARRRAGVAATLTLKEA